MGHGEHGGHGEEGMGEEEQDDRIDRMGIEHALRIPVFPVPPVAAFPMAW